MLLAVVDRTMTTPAPGDLLSRAAGLVTHYGITMASDQVLDIVPGGPPRVVSFGQFADGRTVNVHRPHPEDLPAVLSRVWQVAEIKSPYNLITFNCEHLKNLSLSGKRYSETVLIVLGLVVIGICFARGRGS
ncbi:MAG: hypothetical protein F4Y02_10775 [Chloroflexi bacterium]|nr:hypothetical protein [Chloroflexota bacterium]